MTREKISNILKEKEDAAKKINKVLVGKTSMAKKWLNFMVKK